MKRACGIFLAIVVTSTLLTSFAEVIQELYDRIDSGPQLDFGREYCWEFFWGWIGVFLSIPPIHFLITTKFWSTNNFNFLGSNGSRRISGYLFALGSITLTLLLIFLAYDLFQKIDLKIDQPFVPTLTLLLLTLLWTLSSSYYLRITRFWKLSNTELLEMENIKLKKQIDKHERLKTLEKERQELQKKLEDINSQNKG